MTRKSVLGKGLDALLSGDEDSRYLADDAEAADDKIAQNQQIKHGLLVQIPLDRLVADPGQPRKHFDEVKLQELAASIAVDGIIDPIIVVTGGDGSYIITAGERRVRAARLAGLTEIPAIVRNYTDQKRMEIALIENIQRSDLNPIEEAAAYKNLMEMYNLSQEELAAKAGKSRSNITNALRLLKLSAEVQKSLEIGEISPGHARALLAVTDKKLREKLFIEITGKGLTVREAEKRAAMFNNPPANEETQSKQKPPEKRHPEIIAMEDKFIEKLGTKVVIEGDLSKGRIHVDYYSMEDLERLYEVVM